MIFLMHWTAMQSSSNSSSLKSPTCLMVFSNNMQFLYSPLSTDELIHYPQMSSKYILLPQADCSIHQVHAYTQIHVIMHLGQTLCNNFLHPWYIHFAAGSARAHFGYQCYSGTLYPKNQTYENGA